MDNYELCISIFPSGSVTAMPRPRFAPGAVVRFALRPRSGPPRDATAYAAVRLAVPAGWVEPLTADGRVEVDGQPIRPGDRIDLARAKSLTIRLPEAWPPHLACVPMDLTVLYEDDHVLALDKPPGIVVHPARGHLDNRTVANGVRHRYRADIGRPGVTIGAPHRLDRDTSGVLLFARTTAAYRELVRQFMAREPHKEYWAVVDGRPDFDVRSVDVPLGPDPHTPQRYAVVPEHEGGKPAKTDFYVLNTFTGGALIKAAPQTGRAHQIRLHLAYLGHPIQGDADYNPRDRKWMGGEPRPKRQSLHAQALTFTHPILGARLRVEAPWPFDWPRAWRE